MSEFFETQEEGILCLRCGAATFKTQEELDAIQPGFRLCRDCELLGYTVETVLRGEEPDEGSVHPA